MRIDSNLLNSLRTTYGDVREIVYTWATKEQSLVVRRPNFREYLYFSRHSVNYSEDPNQPPQYELDPDVAEIYFHQIVVYPETIDINRIPPGKILESCMISIEMCDMENPEKLRKMYVNSYNHVNSLLGALVHKLIMIYGIQIWDVLKNAKEEEVMDFVVMGEISSNDMGALAHLASMKDIPFNRRGKLDLNQLIGVNYPDGDGEKHIDPRAQKMKDRAKQYYEQMGVPPERIARMLNERSESVAEQFAGGQPPSDKVDMGSMSDDDLSKMPYDQYMQMKSEGKIMSHEESMHRQASTNKDALAQQIQEDRAQFGERETKIDKIPQLDKLLKVVQSEVRDFE